MNIIEVTASMDVVLLVLRVTLGAMIFLHGYNHLAGPDGVAGTATWFHGIGFRPARVHALMSGFIELVVGVGLIVGLLTAVACAGLVGTMIVAGWAVHRPHGFFIFRDGYEYVLVVGIAAVAVASLGPGRLSIDAVVGVVNYGTTASSVGLRDDLGALVAVGGGLMGAVILLGLGWRPGRADDGSAQPHQTPV